MQEGWMAFKSGGLLDACPYHGIGRGKAQAWKNGWCKAKLAMEQGKLSI
jgi:ribosome modulation factor